MCDVSDLMDSKFLDKDVDRDRLKSLLLNVNSSKVDAIKVQGYRWVDLRILVLSVNRTRDLWLQTQRSRVRFLTLPYFLSSSGSGTWSIQPRQDK
jgi:hypothetical protein